MKRNVPLVKRDGRVIVNAIAIGTVYKDGRGWAYKIALKDREPVGSFSRQSDAVIALQQAWRNKDAETFYDRRDRQAADQVEVNRIYRDEGCTAAVAAIRKLAQAEHAEHRQYDGYWDGPEWTLARVDVPLKSKGGLQADIGDVVLYTPRSDTSGVPAIYSVRLGWMCTVGYGVRPIRSRYTGTPVGPFPVG